MKDKILVQEHLAYHYPRPILQVLARSKWLSPKFIPVIWFFYFIIKLNGTFLFFGKPFSSGLAFALVLIDV
jgi:hypothetical protein